MVFFSILRDNHYHIFCSDNLFPSTTDWSGGQPPRYTYKVDDPNHLQMQFATLVNGLIKRYSNRGNNPAKGYIILFLDVSCT